MTNGDLLPVPWTQPYLDRRERTLRTATTDRELLARFASGEPLPAGYGLGLDERLVEYPWVIAHLPPGPARLLDAGSALNHQFLVEHPRLAEKRIHVATLAPEQECFWARGISYVFEDLRQLPFRDDLYDIVVSVSTIEHIGCDNTFYTGSRLSAERRLEDFVLAAGEIQRVLAPGGTLLMTVPYGRYQFHGAFQQFDRSLLSRAEAALGEMTITAETFYRYTPDGWQLARDEDCSDCEYTAWVSELMRTRQWPDPVPLDPDHAAAARAVACVQLVKT